MERRLQSGGREWLIEQRYRMLNPVLEKAIALPKYIATCWTLGFERRLVPGALPQTDILCSIGANHRRDPSPQRAAW